MNLATSQKREKFTLTLQYNATSLCPALTLNEVDKANRDSHFGGEKG